jgi:hypothetical protein
MMLEEYKGEYYILNDSQNKNNPLIIQRMEDTDTKEDYKTSNKNNFLIIQRMEDKKEECKTSNNKIFCCYFHKKNNMITEIEMATMRKKILTRKKQIDNLFKNNKELFTGIQYNEKYIISDKSLNPFDDIFKNNKPLFISTNPFDSDL